MSEASFVAFLLSIKASVIVGDDLPLVLLAC
jgi:hypothetical protein